MKSIVILLTLLVVGCSSGVPGKIYELAATKCPPGTKLEYVETSPFWRASRRGSNWVQVIVHCSDNHKVTFPVNVTK